MARCVALIGPAHSGKSTLADALAALGGAAAPPASPTEARVLAFDYLGERWTVIDCPGAPDLLGLARDALLAADVAVVVAPPEPDAAALAAPWLRAAEESGAPTMVFVNKADAPQGRLREIVAALQAYARHPMILRQMPLREGEKIVGVVDLVSERAWKWREGQHSQLVAMPADVEENEHERHAALLEQLSEFDDWLLEEIVEEREPASDAVYAICARMLAENRAMEVLFGAAGKGAGVTRLMKALRHEAPGVEALRERLGKAATAVAFGVRRRKHLGRMTLVRALAPGLAQGAKLAGETVGALLDPVAERPGGAAVEPGAVTLAAKADHMPARGPMTAEKRLPTPLAAAPLAPQEARILAAPAERDEAKLGAALASLAEDDAALSVELEGGGRRVGVQGPMHLRAVEATLADAFGLGVEAHPVTPPWRETIAKGAEVHHRHRKQTGGAGQFADVRLTIAPAPRGAGFVFEEVVKGGAVPRNYIPAVEAGAREALAKGPLGFPVVDVVVTLTDGQHHSVDSSDFAFRAAGRGAVQEALAEAAPVLLQPVHMVEIHAPSVFTGGLSTLISGLKGQILGFDRDGDAAGWDLFRCLLPEAMLPDLAPQLRAATQGVGRFETRLDHYEEVYGKEAERISREHGHA
ncbi:MAG: elongation factor G [Rhodobacteraceae bacterium]|nr:MAG: elongation factor G [Paracoccaceae bacterium]